MTDARLLRLQANLSSVIRGKERPIRLLLTGLLARGHVLLEDLPGVGKTTLAKALARSIDCPFRRIQFTPDLLPGDILGVSIYVAQEHRFEFQRGPVFTSILLADEINRTNPRTQAALLEAMNESQVTVDGVTYPLPDPFLVVATQNPVEHAGTYPLPDSQLDRFLLTFGLGYPDGAGTRALLRDQAHGHPLVTLEPVLSAQEVLDLQRRTLRVTLSDPVLDYAAAIAEATRRHPLTAIGASPRGTLHLTRAGQAHALLEGRDHAIPDDLKAIAEPVLAHRLVARDRASRAGGARIVQDILRTVPVPV